MAGSLTEAPWRASGSFMEGFRGPSEGRLTRVGGRSALVWDALPEYALARPIQLETERAVVLVQGPHGISQSLSLIHATRGWNGVVDSRRPTDLLKRGQDKLLVWSALPERLAGYSAIRELAPFAVPAWLGFFVRMLWIRRWTILGQLG
jgi:hypothetical protein